MSTLKTYSQVWGAIEALGYPQVLGVEGYDCVGKNGVLAQAKEAYEDSGYQVLVVDPEWPMLDAVMRRNDRWLVMLSILASFVNTGVPAKTAILFNRTILTGYTYYQLEYQRYGLAEQSAMTLGQVRFGLSQFTDAMNRLGGAIVLVRPSEEDFLKMVAGRGTDTVDEAKTGASLLDLFRQWYALVDEIAPVMTTSFPIVAYTNPYQEG